MRESVTLSRTAAKRQAHKESSMYRQGHGWILRSWDPARRSYYLSGELTWPIARQALADWRRRRALQLQSEVFWSAEDNAYVARVASHPEISALGETEREAIGQLDQALAALSGGLEL